MSVLLTGGASLIRFSVPHRASLLSDRKYFQVALLTRHLLHVSRVCALPSMLVKIVLPRATNRFQF